MKNLYAYTFSNNFNELKKLKKIIDEIGKRYNISHNVLLQIHLSLEELVVNIISYGFEDDKNHNIELRINVNENNLTFYLTDDGKPFNPLKFKPKRKKPDLKTGMQGGFGIVLVKEFMDTVSYKYRKGLNQLTVNKKFS